MNTEEGEIVKRMFQIRAFLDEFIVEGIGPQLENIGFSRKGKSTLMILEPPSGSYIQVGGGSGLPKRLHRG